MLPTIRGARSSFAAVAADAGAEPWSRLVAQELLDTVSGAAPQQRTFVKAAWDAEELRIFFEVEDTHIWATYTQRDALLYEEEVVEVFLDPVGDLESYFEIELNPLNTVFDLVVRRNRSGFKKDFAWQCEGMRTAVTRHAGGWSAEFAIPWRSLVAELPVVGSRWRVNFCRIDRPPGVERELSAWSPTGRANFHTPEKFGVLEFVE